MTVTKPVAASIKTEFKYLQRSIKDVNLHIP